ncbi:MAG: adenylate/guanylate cyclase domain-containing protein [Armatimonadetes bacterium]|nr:adenylate/guanylate cyclase domain-containing protein [Armatimonadota bacterium]
MLSKAPVHQLPGADTALLLGMGCLLGFILSRLSPWPGIGIACVLELAIFFTYRELYYRGYHLSAFQTMLGIAWNLVILIFYFHHVSEKRHKRIDNVFGHFMSDKVKDKIMLDFDEQVTAGSLGETRFVTVIETDIRGFTSMSEKLTSEEVVQRLNIYFEKMIPILFKYEGTYDKFVGDALLAYFGAPIPDPEHAKHAVLCSLEMQEAVEDLRRQGVLDIHIGIGVNTGDVTVGSIGAKAARVVQYTIIGDTVNLAARLCSVAERGEVIISSYTYDLCKDSIGVEPREPVKVKGKTDPIQIFLALSPEAAKDGNNVPKGGVLSGITKQ